MSYLTELLRGFADSRATQPATDRATLARRAGQATGPYERGRLLSQLATLLAREFQGRLATDDAPATGAECVSTPSLEHASETSVGVSQLSPPAA